MNDRVQLSDRMLRAMVRTLIMAIDIINAPENVSMEQLEKLVGGISDSLYYAISSIDERALPIVLSDSLSKTAATALATGYGRARLFSARLHTPFVQKENSDVEFGARSALLQCAKVYADTVSRDLDTVLPLVHSVQLNTASSVDKRRVMACAAAVVVYQSAEMDFLKNPWLSTNHNRPHRVEVVLESEGNSLSLDARFLRTLYEAIASTRTSQLSKSSSLVLQSDSAFHSAPEGIGARMKLLRGLEPGWLDGRGKPFDPKWLDELETRLNRLVFFYGVPMPFIYPVEDGEVQLEWAIGPWETSALFRQDDDKIELSAVNTDEKEGIEGSELDEIVHHDDLNEVNNFIHDLKVKVGNG